MIPQNDYSPAPGETEEQIQSRRNALPQLRSSCPSDAAPCSAFWSCVEGSVAIIIETLPRCGSSSLVHESKSMREALARLVGIMERGEIMEIRTSETLEELEARDMREHVCAMNRDMMGKCFVCGSESHND